MSIEKDREIFKELLNIDPKFRKDASVMFLGKNAKETDRHGFLCLYKETFSLPSEYGEEFRAFLRFLRMTGVEIVPSSEQGLEMKPIPDRWHLSDGDDAVKNYRRIWSSIPVWYQDWTNGVLFSVA